VPTTPLVATFTQQQQQQHMQQLLAQPQLSRRQSSKNLNQDAQRLAMTMSKPTVNSVTGERDSLLQPPQAPPRNRTQSQPPSLPYPPDQLQQQQKQQQPLANGSAHLPTNMNAAVLNRREGMACVILFDSFEILGETNTFFLLHNEIDRYRRLSCKLKKSISYDCVSNNKSISSSKINRTSFIRNLLNDNKLLINDYMALILLDFLSSRSSSSK
jgi:hypothetical protein